MSGLNFNLEHFLIWFTELEWVWFWDADDKTRSGTVATIQHNSMVYAICATQKIYNMIQMTFKRKGGLLTVSTQPNP